MDGTDGEPLDGPDDNVVPPVVLTDGQRAAIRERIHDAIKVLWRGRARAGHFHNANVWVLRTYAFIVTVATGWTPGASYGATFGGLSRYVLEKETQAEYEEVEEPEANL